MGFLPVNIFNNVKQRQWQMTKNFGFLIVAEYRNDPKLSDRYAWANSADPDQTAPKGAVWSGLKEQSDLGLHCLPFRLHHLDSLLYGRAT